MKRSQTRSSSTPVRGTTAEVARTLRKAYEPPSSFSPDIARLLEQLTKAE